MNELLYLVGGAIAVWIAQKMGVIKPPPAQPSPVTPGPGPTPSLPGTGNPYWDLILQELLRRLQGEMSVAAQEVATRVLPPREQANNITNSTTSPVS